MRTLHIYFDNNLYYIYKVPTQTKLNLFDN